MRMLIVSLPRPPPPKITQAPAELDCRESKHWLDQQISRHAPPPRACPH
eukprot:CAMPEP_0184710028 /NCGR_PEP_ID=MMETSP0314-20130426/1003_1 /TAXON_ID=38298 /ORGANISM="Rhodella maculata, Strain CCMP 736" /LENGTH=48 /DNA_ID= /DNA_START= /DNA_END= /DNA_ORIENTATION=